jgi:hypothetical protein
MLLVADGGKGEFLQAWVYTGQPFFATGKEMRNYDPSVTKRVLTIAITRVREQAALAPSPKMS